MLRNLSNYMELQTSQKLATGYCPATDEHSSYPQVLNFTFKAILLFYFILFYKYSILSSSFMSSHTPLLTNTNHDACFMQLPLTSCRFITNIILSTVKLQLVLYPSRERFKFYMHTKQQVRFQLSSV